MFSTKSLCLLAAAMMLCITGHAVSGAMAQDVVPVEATAAAAANDPTKEASSEELCL